MNFRTTFSIPKSKPVDYNDAIMLCGSCFVENIGEKLDNYCFNTMINPFGILFDPISLARSLEMIIDRRIFTARDTVFYNNLYHSFFHHSRFSRPNQQEHLRLINDASEKAHDFLKSATRLIITLGTAWTYRHKERNAVVSSCHKIPQENFEKYLLSVDEIITVLSEIFARLFSFNPNIEITLTISPVRHIKDGFVENQYSKSTIILAVKKLIEKKSHPDYFPAYELMMDDLRDYRFYGVDMLHPSTTAVSYIWERFVETYFDDKTQNILAKVEKIRTASLHRPFHAQSTSYKDFCMKNLTEIEELMRQFPNASFSGLAEIFKEKLKI
ncbi:MAG: GSCFA domain-containing protein [Bacteroidales bacterium]|jgi:hypothetical protein|nr:GSCFA domain-containing protein [Bacteroidales bacterium]